MHLLLTDRATCPRCGPGFGLILLAEAVEERRVLEGHLGCPNCREHFPVRGGFGDLRHPSTGPDRAPPSPLDPGPAGSPPPEAEAEPDRDPPGGEEGVEGAFRLAALLGVERGPGFLLLMGPPARHARKLAAMLEEIEVVAVGPGNREGPETPGVSRLVYGEGIPFHAGTFRGVALQAEWTRTHLEHAIRVLSPGSRIVLMDPGEGDRERLEAAGKELLLVSAKALVAVA